VTAGRECFKCIARAFDFQEFIPGPEPDPAIQRRLMKSIAKVICNQSGFIVEEELQRIIMPLIKTEKTLVTLDAVFQSLGISSVDEMQALARYMLKYCKTMKGVMSKVSINNMKTDKTMLMNLFNSLVSWI